VIIREAIPGLFINIGIDIPQFVAEVATPQIDTLFKVLKPLGYTLAIVPVQQAQTTEY